MEIPLDILGATYGTRSGKPEYGQLFSLLGQGKPREAAEQYSVNEDAQVRRYARDNPDDPIAQALANNPIARGVGTFVDEFANPAQWAVGRGAGALAHYAAPYVAQGANAARAASPALNYAATAAEQAASKVGKAVEPYANRVEQAVNAQKAKAGGLIGKALRRAGAATATGPLAAGRAFFDRYAAAGLPQRGGKTFTDAAFQMDAAAEHGEGAARNFINKMGRGLTLAQKREFEKLLPLDENGQPLYTRDKTKVPDPETGTDMKYKSGPLAGKPMTLEDRARLFRRFRAYTDAQTSRLGIRDTEKNPNVPTRIFFPRRQFQDRNGNKVPVFEGQDEKYAHVSGPDEQAIVGKPAYSTRGRRFAGTAQKTGRREDPMATILDYEDELHPEYDPFWQAAEHYGPLHRAIANETKRLELEKLPSIDPLTGEQRTTPNVFRGPGNLEVDPVTGKVRASPQHDLAGTTDETVPVTARMPANYYKDTIGGRLLFGPGDKGRAARQLYVERKARGKAAVAARSDPAMQALAKQYGFSPALLGTRSIVDKQVLPVIERLRAAKRNQKNIEGVLSRVVKATDPSKPLAGIAKLTERVATDVGREGANLQDALNKNLGVAWQARQEAQMLRSAAQLEEEEARNPVTEKEVADMARQMRDFDIEQRKNVEQHLFQIKREAAPRPKAALQDQPATPQVQALAAELEDVHPEDRILSDLETLEHKGPLYHGTSEEAANAILKGGFRFDRSLMAHGDSMPQAAYFGLDKDKTEFFSNAVKEYGHKPGMVVNEAGLSSPLRLGKFDPTALTIARGDVRRFLRNKGLDENLVDPVIAEVLRQRGLHGLIEPGAQVGLFSRYNEGLRDPNVPAEKAPRATTKRVPIVKPEWTWDPTLLRGAGDWRLAGEWQDVPKKYLDLSSKPDRNAYSRADTESNIDDVATQAGFGDENIKGDEALRNWMIRNAEPLKASDYVAQARKQIKDLGGISAEEAGAKRARAKAMRDLANAKEASTASRRFAEKELGPAARATVGATERATKLLGEASDKLATVRDVTEKKAALMATGVRKNAAERVAKETAAVDRTMAQKLVASEFKRIAAEHYKRIYKTLEDDFNDEHTEHAPDGNFVKETLIPGLESPSRAGKVIDNSFVNFMKGQESLKPAEQKEAKGFWNSLRVFNSMARSSIVIMPQVHGIVNLGRPYLAEGGDLPTMLKILRGEYKPPKGVRARAIASGAFTERSALDFTHSGPNATTAIPERAEMAAAKAGRFANVVRPLAATSMRLGDVRDAWSRWLFDNVEQGYAMDLFDRYTKAGMSDADAAMKVRNVVGRGDNISPREIQAHMRQIFYFYPWMKTVVPYWIKKGILDPKQWNIPLETIKSINEAQGYDDRSKPFTVTAGHRANGDFRRLTAPLPERVLADAADLARLPYDAVRAVTGTGPAGNVLQDAYAPVHYIAGHLNPFLELGGEAVDAAGAYAHGRNPQKGNTFYADPKASHLQQTAGMLGNIVGRFAAPIARIEENASDPLGGLATYPLGSFTYGVPAQKGYAKRALELQGQGLSAEAVRAELMREGYIKPPLAPLPGALTPNVFLQGPSPP